LPAGPQAYIFDRAAPELNWSALAFAIWRLSVAAYGLRWRPVAAACRNFDDFAE